MVKVSDERVGEVWEREMSEGIVVGDEVREIVGNVCVSGESGVGDMDGVMGGELSDMVVEEGEKGGVCVEGGVERVVEMVRVEVGCVLEKEMERVLDGKEEVVDVVVGVEGLVGVGVEWGGRRIGKGWSGREVGGEVGDSGVEGDGWDDGRFRIVVDWGVF